MIDQDNREKADMTSEAEQPSKRRAYATPVVTDLGDVRELTRGGHHSQTEAGETPFP